ncbi:NAD-dependent epimerase/dehydratase family protein [Pseudoclavibacter sp. RFBA6]|uniref:NAD-dependent epimerase/dehydratase family protein n=1 Tax=Pseudoclavibacter sp. RFBA6 TaxID=2080573 RepID=UPI000CE72862|nr:NAD-dependent epimerase/dehydratase family protein [Pseudoclavibacter sp. RFBA6]PPG40577.1 epimerase [Pseudoclavibacter sp. RFBA6]
MKVFLTGATGYIGSAILRALLANGHVVTAAVRNEEKAATVREAGAKAVVVDLSDRAALAPLLRQAEGVIHTASGPEVDPVFVPVVLNELVHSPTQFVHTSGIWLFGDNPAITEESEPNPPEIVSWRVAIDRQVINSNVNTAIVAPAVVYGGRGGLTQLLAGDGPAPIPLVGDGTQRWTLVHVDDLADLYVRVLEKGAAVGYVIAAGGENPTVREIAASAYRGIEEMPELVEETGDETRARLGSDLAGALLQDQVATGRYAREAYGWVPTPADWLGTDRS